jgi:hypothetical protein
MLALRCVAFAADVINWLIFITVVQSVYSAVRTDSLYKADYVSFFKTLIDTVTARCLLTNNSSNYSAAVMHRSLLYNGYRVFPGGKAAGMWCWPPTPF